MMRSGRGADRYAGYFLAGVVVFSAILVNIWARPSRAAPPQRYEELVALARQDATAVDFTALRHAYADSAQYKPYDAGDSTPVKSMMTAFRAGDCAEVVKQAQAVLEINYLRINAHLAAAICYRQLKQDRPSAQHETMARGLLDSILASGNGASAKSAFVVIAVDEEYSTLNRLELKALRQRLVNDDGHQFDVFEAADKAGHASAVYFNVDRPLTWLDRQLKAR